MNKCEADKSGAYENAPYLQYSVGRLSIAAFSILYGVFGNVTYLY